MAPAPKITRVLTVSGVGPVRRERIDPAVELPNFQPTISVGLVLDDGQVIWGDCLLALNGTSAAIHPETAVSTALRTIEGVVAPALIGQQVGIFHKLAERIDALTEEGWVTQEQPLPTDQKPHLTRKDILTGRFIDALRPDHEPVERRVAMSRPLSPGIRYGVTLALLSACAYSRRTCQAQVILDTYNLDVADARVPIHVELEEVKAGRLIPLLLNHAASLGYTTGNSNFKEGLQGNLENLVRYIRLLQEQTPDLFMDSYQPVVHINVHGALGLNHDNNPGKIFGTMFNLERNVQKYPVRLEDVAVLDTLEAQVEIMARLCGYARSRKMGTELVAGAWIDSLESLDRFLDAEAASMIHINPLRLGGIHTVVQGILACKKRGVAVMLGGSPSETARSARTTAQIAVATQPDLVMAKPGYQGDVAMTHVENEMNQALAQLSALSKRAG